MSELIGILISVLARLCLGISDFFDFVTGMTEGLNENSRVGESPLDRDLRKKRQRWSRLTFALACLLIVIGLCIGLAMKR